MTELKYELFEHLNKTGTPRQANFPQDYPEEMCWQHVFRLPGTAGGRDLSQVLPAQSTPERGDICHAIRADLEISPGEDRTSFWLTCCTALLGERFLNVQPKVHKYLDII